MAQLRVFEDPGIGARVFLSTPGEPKALEVDDHGVLEIPSEIKPTAFHLSLLLPQQSRIIITQKNVGQEKGGYHNHALAQVNSTSGIVEWVMYDPIQVMRQGDKVWTSWHAAKPNRVDCWLLEENGRLGLFQVGVVTHDDGETFHLLGEWRWRGQLFLSEKGIVAKPEHPGWGPALIQPGESRHEIVKDEKFQELLATTQLQLWRGTSEEIHPPLGEIPRSGYARIQWYIPFAGQTGQGIAVLNDGSSAWVHGVDILDPPDEDGIKRLSYNDLITYQGEPVKWGTKEEAPPKLLGVRRARA